MNDYDYAQLLTEYRKVWSNRALLTNDNEEETLKEAILRELRDENTHPRLRKSCYEKYYLATKRIARSAIDNHDKVSLIQLHTELAEEIISQ
ncbi:hypothetical protein [Mesobacillus zeae]|uniref:Uncharacterized protein n=1 Tax=Mesobacillus zeae TaxID=1917180 RepID=A0A398BCX8_9BACI|nr:hypothetical protein [Mesobacillus zeae]RID85516.1 hypothetical protein D1970_08045 [Mesobacillus zeae]